MNQEEKLNKLKDILLMEQRAQALLVQKQIADLEKSINVKKNFSKRVDPIIDEKLQEFVINMPKTIGPTITSSIKEEIRNSQDDVVDALFPIIGKMIKKYIQSEFQKLKENINNQVNKKFSIKGFKRNIKSKFTGVNQTDLILSDSRDYQVEQIFMIEKNSGILKACFSRGEKGYVDKEMVSGMLTAIKSFIEDAFQKSNQALELIEYDLYKIHIINFKLFYFATVVSGVLDTKSKDNLEDKLYQLRIDMLKDNKEIDLKKLNKKINQIFQHEFF